MKKNLFLFVLTLVLHLLLLTPLSGKSMHLLIMADDDSNIGQGVLRDMENIKNSFSYLASTMDIPIRTKILNSKRNLLTYTHVITWLDKEQIAADDVVILYFSGHGGRTLTSPTIWPYVRFPTDRVEFTGVIRRLFKKKAALYVILFDCCNKLVQNSIITKSDPPIIMNYNALDRKQIKQKCLDLFFKSKGLVIVSSASPGQYSFGPKSGGYFTTFFLNNLGQEVQKEKAHWKELLSKTQTECRALCEEFIKDKQWEDQEENRETPQYRVFLRAKRKSSAHLRRYLFERCLPENAQSSPRGF